MRDRIGQALAVILALGSGLALALPAHASAAPSCDGRRATHVGTPQADVIVTGRGNDVIVAFGGDDSIRSGSGDDRVCAGPGDDRVSTELGRDAARGEGGADLLHGGSNGDELRGGSGDDDVFGGILDDRISGDGGDDLLIGGHGVDRMRGGPGDDWLRGGTNDDVFDGGSSAGDDDVASFATAMPPFDGCEGMPAAEGVVVRLASGAAGGDGCDRLSGIESVMGSAFGDSIAGWSGGSIGGGGGADVCSGSARTESCDDPGGDSAGDAWVESWSPGPSSRSDPGRVVIDDRGDLDSSLSATGSGGIRYVVLYGYGGDDSLSVGGGFALGSIGHLDGGPGDDSALGGPGEDVLFGYSGRDSLAGGGGDDALLALGETVTGEGDRLDAGDGDDQLVSNYACGGHRFDGGDGVDVAGFARSAARHPVAAALGGAARVRGAPGCSPTAIRASEVLEGTAGGDVLHGDGDSNPYIWGREGADLIFGHGGNDRLEGGAGRDRLDGGPGRDGLYGMAGPDLLLARDGRRDAKLCRGRDAAAQVRRDRVDPRPRNC